MTATALHGRHIVITRPTAQAEQLVALVTAAGATPVLLPLIAIAPLADYTIFEAQLAKLPRYDWLIFISTNAVQQGMPRIIKACGGIPDHLRFAAIGPVTAAELESFGVGRILIPAGRFDSESLLATAEMQAVEGRRCMIVRGVGGRELLARTLAARGATVVFAECYRRFNPQSDGKALQALWRSGEMDALVVTSSEAMRSLLALAREDAISGRVAPWLRNTTICVNHARIGEAATAAGLRVQVAAAPGDAAMLQCLKQALCI